MRRLGAVSLMLLASTAAAQSTIEETARAINRRAQEAVISRSEMHKWERHVRGFRREHNFALTSGVTSGVWYVRKLGALGDDYDHRFDTSGIYSRFQYSFHLPWIGGLGYMLGSSLGYHHESTDLRRRSFRPSSEVKQFPGVLAGIVLNFNPVFRIGTAIDANLERHDHIVERSAAGDTDISITMQAYDLSGFIDVFYDLAWALRLEGHRREVLYERPREADNFPVNAKLRKEDRWLGVGFVLHLL